MSAPKNAPYGLVPLDGITNTPYEEFPISATLANSLFTGDPVIYNTTGGQGGTIARYLVDTDATAGPNAVPVLGVFLGCTYYDTNGMLIRSPKWVAGTPVAANKPITALVACDANIKYRIQVSTMTANVADATMTRAMFSQNFTFGLGQTAALPTPNPLTGNLALGTSAYFLNQTPATTNYVLATLPLKVVDYAPKALQSIYDANGAVLPYVQVIVRLNNHVNKPGNIGFNAV